MAPASSWHAGDAAQIAALPTQLSHLQWAEGLQTSPGEGSNIPEMGASQIRAARLSPEERARRASAFATHSVVNRVIITPLKREEEHMAHK